MKRDWDIFRQALLAVEAMPRGGSAFSLDGVDRDTAMYHLVLAWKAGYVEAIDTSTTPEWTTVIPSSLTPAGHDFLDRIRDDRTWEGFKTKAGEGFKTMTLEAFKAVVTKGLTEISVAYLRQHLGGS